jgi:hypothetical protein
MSKSTRTTQELHAHALLPNGVHFNITGADQSALQKTIQKLYEGPVKFEKDAESDETFLYHNSFDNGETPCGWITQYRVPEALSVDYLRKLQEAA